MISPTPNTAQAQGRGRKKAPYPVGAKMDQLADALAEHGSIARAAKEIGVSQPYANAMFSRMRKRLGEWAR